MAGGKVVKVDRVEWRAISDAQQAVNALSKGEIDFVEQPSHDLLGTLKKDPNVSVFISPPLKGQYVFRPNHLHKPFDNPKIRQALWYAFNQEDFLMATIGDENYIKECKALFICDTPFASTKGMDGLLTSNAKKAQELLKEAGYDGTPVVLMHSTDLKVLTNLAPVAKSLMEKAGFKVDMQSMDWQTLVARRAKKDPPNAGGWNAFLTAWVAADVMNPVSTAYLNSACDKALVRLAVRRRSSRSCATISPAKPTRQSRRRLLRRCNCAPSRRRPRFRSASMCSRSRCARTSRASSLRRCRCSGTSKSPSDVSGAGGGRFAARAV